MSSKILLRRGTAAQWASANPILGSGELGVETDTLKFKIGNGTSTWTQLTSYANITPSDLTSAINGLINAAPSTLDTLNELAAAINNDSSFSTTVNNLLSGKVSKSGGDIITSATTSTIGLIIKAITSQTANLQEWQNSAGTVLSLVNQSGEVRAPLFGSTSTGKALLYTAASATGEFRIDTNVAANKGLVVRGAPSQSANLQEWQDSGGNVLGTIASNGSLRITNISSTSNTGAYTNHQSDSVTIIQRLTTAPNLIIKGAASQTADLQQWTNSGGTALAKISAYGDLTIPDARVAIGSSSLLANTMLFANTAYSTYTPIVSRGAPGQTADLQQWQNNSGAVLAKTDSTGSFTGRAFNASGYVSTNSSGGTYTNYWCKLADLTLPAQYTDANLYMDFYINGPGFTYVPRGKLFVRVKQQSPLASAPETPTIVVYNGEGTLLNASDFALVAVQNDSSLTKYELYYKLPFDWAALVYNPTSSVGLVNFYDTVLPVATLPSGTKTYGRNSDGKFNSISITPDANNAINLIVKPIAGQTYNLTEWQNSSGNIISYVTSAGAIASNTAITATSFVKSGGTASQFLKADGSTDSSTYLNSTTSSYVAGHHPEGRILASAALVNDLGNARLRGSTFTFTNISPSNSDIDKMFDGTANFLMISPTSSQTFPIVIEFTLPRTLSWGAVVGIGFGTSTWRTNSVKIEAFSNGAWVTCIDTTTNTSEDVLVGIPGSNSSGTTKLRYTLANPNSSQLRICHLWAYNYNSDMWTHLQMPRAGGTMYGALSTKGAISVLNSSNTAMSYLNQDGSGAFATADPYGGFSWNSYGNLGVRTLGASGGQGATVTIGSMTQSSSTAALTLYGHVEFGSLTNSAPIQTWSKSDGTLLAKVDQFGAFTVNINSASSVPLTLKAASSQSANIQEWKNSANVVKLAVDSTGFIRFDDQTSAPTIKWGNATVWESVGGTASMRINPYGPGYVGLIVKGFASQTADLQQWQDSSETVLAGIGPNGRIYAQGKSGNTDDLLYLRRADNNISLYVNKDAELRGNFSIRLNQDPPIDTQAFIWSGTGSRSAFGVSGTSSTNPTFYVKGGTAQTSNLTEWQDSSGTVLARISNLGGLFSNSNISQSSSGRTFLGGISDYNAFLNVSIPTASRQGIVIRANASQTANLQEWQNSAGTVLAKVDKDGNFNNQSSFASVLTTSVAATGGNISTTYGFYNNLSPTTNAGIAVMPWAANLPGAIVRGYTGQTANLQEWQDNAGTVKSSITASGSLELNGKDIELMNIMGAF